jgi:hypothetical protein
MSSLHIHHILMFLLLVLNWLGWNDWDFIGCCIGDRKKMMVQQICSIIVDFISKNLEVI